MKETKIAIIHSARLIREGISRSLNGIADFDIVLEVDWHVMLVEHIENTGAKVVILEVNEREQSFFESLRWLRYSCPNVKLIALSDHISEETIVRLIQAGISGHVTLFDSTSKLVEAIHRVDQGWYFFENEACLEKSETWPKKNNIVEFSPRELEVIKLVAAQKKSREIAVLLKLGIRTVESHKYNLINKTNSRNIIGVLIYALRKGQLTLADLPSPLSLDLYA